MKKFSVFLWAIIFALTVSGSAYALSFTEDFEDPGPGFREAGLGADWTGLEPLPNRMGTYDPSATQYTGLAAGQTVAWINSRNDGAPLPNQFARYLGEDLVLGTYYTFQVDVGWRNDFTPKPLYEIVFGARINDVWTELEVIGNSDQDLTRGAFTQVTLEYLATGFAPSDVLGEIGIQLRDVGLGDFQQVNYDNISVTSVVPEPATMLLLGSGLLGLAAVGRRKFFKK